MNQILKQVLFVIIILLYSSIKSYSQQRNDSIEIKKTFLRTTFYFDGEVLPPRGLIDIIKKGSPASAEMKIAKRNHLVSSVLRIAGGALVIGSFEQFLRFNTTESPHWILAASGAGLISISFPFSTAYTKHATKAVTVYNNELQK